MREEAEVVVAASEVASLEESPEARRMVSVCRRWSEAADEYLSADESHGLDLVAVVRRLPVKLCSLTVTTVVLHEELTVAFEYALRIHRAVLPQDPSDLGDVLGRLDHVLRSPPDDLTLLELKRLETLCELIRLTLIHLPEPIPVNLVDSFVSSIRGLQFWMLDCQGSHSFTRDLRAQASSLRRAYVALCTSLFSACPGWVRLSQDAFLDLATRSLGSPLLLSAGLACFPPGEVPPKAAETIAAHLRKGVLGLDKYQSAAVKDLLASVGSIAGMEQGLPLLVFDNGVIVRTIAKMYSKMPKAADRKADSFKEWKVQLMGCFEVILRRVRTAQEPLSLPEDLDISQVALDMVKAVASDLILIKSHLIGDDGEKSILLDDEVEILTLLHYSSSLVKHIAKLSTEAVTELLHAATCFLVSFTEIWSSFTEDWSSFDAEERTPQFTSVFLCVFAVVKDNLIRQVIFDDEVIQLLSEVDLYINLSILLLKSGRLTADNFKSQLLFLGQFNSMNPLFATHFGQIQSSIMEALERYVLIRADSSALDFDETLASYANTLSEALNLKI